MSPILFFIIFFTCTGVGKIFLQINPAAVALINILIAAWEGLKYSFSNVTYKQCYNIMQSLKKKKNQFFTYKYYSQNSKHSHNFDIQSILFLKLSFLSHSQRYAKYM